MSDSKPSDQEVFESIPREELRDLGDTSRQRRVWYLVAGAALAAVLVFSVVRTFSAPDPRVAVSQTATPSTTAAPEVAAFSQPATDSVALPSPPDPFAAAAATLTEADLQAGEDPTAVGGGVYDERRAASYSEWFVLEFFTLDGTERSASLKRWLPARRHPSRGNRRLGYRPFLCGMGADPVGWALGRRALAGSGGPPTAGFHRRRRPQPSTHPVSGGAGGFGSRDSGHGRPARFIPLPEATAGQWWVGEEWETPPTAAVKTARGELLLAEAGQPAFSRMGEVWRVEWAVIDAAGISWPVSLWKGPRRGAPSRRRVRASIPSRSGLPESIPARAAWCSSPLRPPCSP